MAEPASEFRFFAHLVLGSVSDFPARINSIVPTEEGWEPVSFNVTVPANTTAVLITVLARRNRGGPGPERRGLSALG